MILMLDNYDSFTYNLVQYLGELGADLQVYRNDKIALEAIVALKPAKIVISPGPCTPEKAGISIDVIKEFAGQVPILGVCLGHQSIGVAFGGQVTRGDYPVHGKTSMVKHDGKTIFSGIENPFEATRYHSLIVDRETLPEALEVSAETEDGVIMGMRHRELPIEGVQFHPESILTGAGMQLLKNWLDG